MPVPAVVETSARLKKGGTVAGALHGLGIAAKDVSNAIVALKSRVRLNRLPVGQEITVKLGPADGADEPLLMALAIRPEPRREITLERDDSGDFSVEEQVFETVAKLQRACGDGRRLGDQQRRGGRRAAAGAGGNAARVFLGRELPARHQGRRPLRRADRAGLDQRRLAGRCRPGAVGRADHRRRRAELQHLPLQAARRRGVLLQQRGRERRQGTAAHAAQHEPHLLALRHAPSSGAEIHPPACRHRLRRTSRHADPGRRRRPRHRSRPQRRLRPVGQDRPFGRAGDGIRAPVAHRAGRAAQRARAAGPGHRLRRQQRPVDRPASPFRVHRNGRPVDPLSMARTAQRSRLAGEDLARFKARVAEIDRARDSIAAPAPP